MTTWVDLYSVYSLSAKINHPSLHVMCWFSLMWFPPCRSLQTLKPWSSGFITFRLSGWRHTSSLKSTFGPSNKMLFSYCVSLHRHTFTIIVLNFRHISISIWIVYIIHFRFCLLPSWCCFGCRLPSRGHEAYLRTGPHYDFDHYRQLVHEITQTFCGISTEVLEIKGKLHHEFDRPDLSEHIEKLQSKEKQKLELVGKQKTHSVWF